MSTECKLPEKASELIEVAVHDLELVEGDPKYKINMNEWHTARYDGGPACAVCFAGSVMAKTCEVEADRTFEPWDFGSETAGRLRALNMFRTGAVHEGLNSMDVPSDHWSRVPERISVHAYRYYPDEFKEEMRGLAAMLKKEGL